MKNLLVVGAMFDFPGDFPEYNVISCPLDSARWFLREDNALWSRVRQKMSV